MFSQELIAQVKKIEIKTRRIVDELTAGAYHSVFKGKGLEFSEVREYTFDDDIRDIDWNVTARTGKPFIKRFTEDRELNVMLLVDASASTMFGGGDKTKHQQIVEIAALLALSAIRNNDRVGLLIFTDQTELYLPLRSGRRHGLRLIRELLAHDASGKKTDINSALKHSLNSLKKRSVIFMISDLSDDNDFSHQLKMINKRHDVVAVRTLDQLEKQWPENGQFVVEDSESHGVSVFNATASSRTQYRERAAREHDNAAKCCMEANVDLIDIVPGAGIVEPLLRFFKQRKVSRR